VPFPQPSAIKQGYLIGHNVQVNVLDGVLGNELGQLLRHNVQVNAFNDALCNELGQVTINTINLICKHSS